MTYDNAQHLAQIKARTDQFRANALDALSQTTDVLYAVRVSAALLRCDSREVQHHCAAILQSAVDDSQSMINDIMILCAHSHVMSFTLNQFSQLHLKRADRLVTDKATYCTKALVLLELADFDKATKTVTLKTDSEVFMSLYNSARYKLEDDTLYSKKELDSLLALAVEYKLVTD